MEHYDKFLAKLDRTFRLKILAAVLRIKAGETVSLDIKPLKGLGNIFRCRIRDVRIIFAKHPTGNVVVDLGFRKDVYKKLRK